MSARSAAPIALFLAAALFRIHNAWVAPPLAGFDGPFHAAYIGILHFDGRIPLQHEGWNTFHPPLYYLICDGIWRLLPDAWTPHAVHFAMQLVSVAFSLLLGFAVHRSARLLFPDRDLVALYALALVLFLPMHVGPSIHIGNEMAVTSLSALSLLQLLRVLARPADRWAPIGLGALLALALLTKFSAAVVAAAALGTLAVEGISRVGLRPGALRVPAVAVAVMIVLTAPYFGRNMLHYGTPSLAHFDISENVMRQSGFGELRPWRAYVDFTPDIVRDPTANYPHATQAVWPVTFVTTWYDVYNTAIDAKNPWSLRFAPVLFACGALFSGLSLVGLLALWTGRARSAIPFATFALSALLFLALAAYVSFTRWVATFEALKGIYLGPGVVPFCVFAGLGLDLAARPGRVARGLAYALLAVYLASVATLFWVGGLAPLRLDPATFYLAAYSDPPTQRVYDYFVGPQRRWPRAQPPAAP